VSTDFIFFCEKQSGREYWFCIIVGKLFLFFEKIVGKLLVRKAYFCRIEKEIKLLFGCTKKLCIPAIGGMLYEQRAHVGKSA
jgi:hypothetical protein